MNRLLCLPALFAIFGATPSWSKDLTGHFGIGFNTPLVPTGTTTLPAIDVKYAFSEAMAVSGGLGLDTQSSSSSVALGAKFYRNAWSEENSHFYVGASLYFITTTSGSNSDPGVLLGAFIGDEFFFQGLPRLGFSFEAGITLETSPTVRFRTDGGSFVITGIHYYF